VPYDPTLYLGSAAHYRYCRPAYSPELEAVLTQEAGLDGNGRLLDAGCGPGVLTVRLAHLFGQAVGLDPDAGMLARRVAAPPRKKQSGTSGGSRAWPRTCPRSRQGRTGW
jgi:SAM-dependent methyltransferase